MLVYGDAVRRETVAHKLGQIRRYLAQAVSSGRWIVAHGLLVAALIEAGELAQGVADRTFEAAGRRDGRSEEGERALALTLALAKAVGRSWDQREFHVEKIAASIAAFEAAAGESELTIKLAEGFAHYAVYPETYWEAARPLAGCDLLVIGLRSIGTTLAAMVAAGAGAPCPTTVRPVGHPFGRTLALAEPLSIPSGADVAIADEGPGLSGSSIVAVANALNASGVGPQRIHVFPSHANGPGSQATEEVRKFWNSAMVHLRSFDEAILWAKAPHSLPSWVEDLTGEPVGDLREITGGEWRGTRAWPNGDPPVHPWQEKRKFLLSSRSGTWLLKYVGVGAAGLRKYERATALADAGFAAPVLGFRHGFLVERWHDDARALDPFGADRPRLVRRIGTYLGFRARHFATGPDRGASSDQLFEMLRINAKEEFGEPMSRAVERWRPPLRGSRSAPRRIETDNRLHAWEWLVLPDGAILKADALDHHLGHDLIGCQDITWDIAGASVEFTLSPGEQADVTAEIERVAGLAVERARVPFATLCYTAFQLGYYREAAASTTDRGEIARIRSAAERYSSCLRALLAGETEPNTPSAY